MGFPTRESLLLADRMLLWLRIIFGVISVKKVQFLLMKGNKIKEVSCQNYKRNRNEDVLDQDFSIHGDFYCLFN